MACPGETVTENDEMPSLINFLSKLASHSCLSSSTVKSNLCGTFCLVPVGGKLVT